jgi:hypothetical protein
VRTELSNLNKLVVHFFDARQKNEPKKTRMGEAPHVPPFRVLPPNDEIIWLNRTRLLHCGNFAFAASKRTAKTAGLSMERKAVKIYAVLPLASS